MSRRYDTYRPGAPTTCVDNSLRKSDHRTRYQGRMSDDTDNSNNIPVAPWNQHHSPDAARNMDDHEDHRNYRLPRVYNSAIDGIIGRTVRAYHLVVDYERACPNGHRWTHEHIEMIRHAGRNLDSDRAALYSLRATLARGDDTVPVSRIRSDAYELRDYCLEIQDLIKVHEQKPVIYEQAVEVDNNGRPIITAIRGVTAGG